MTAADREAGILPPEPDSETDSITEAQSAGDPVGPPSESGFGGSGNGSHAHNLSIETVQTSDISRLVNSSDGDLHDLVADDVYGRSSPTAPSASTDDHHGHDFQ